MLNMLRRVLRSRELVYLTRHIPHTKFWRYNKTIKPLLAEPILDLGCSKGESFWYMKVSGNITGIDLFPPYLEIAAKKGVYNKLLLKNILDIEDGELDLEKFNTVVALDVLEHLTYENAEKTIKIMMGIGETQILSVPCGECPQSSNSGNELQEHISSFTPEFFTDRGFTIFPYYQLTIKKGLNFFDKAILTVRRSPG